MKGMEKSGLPVVDDLLIISTNTKPFFFFISTLLSTRQLDGIALPHSRVVVVVLCSS